jgi:hypothetical protein
MKKEGMGTRKKESRINQLIEISSFLKIFQKIKISCCKRGGNIYNPLSVRNSAGVAQG